MHSKINKYIISITKKAAQGKITPEEAGKNIEKYIDEFEEKQLKSKPNKDKDEPYQLPFCL